MMSYFGIVISETMKRTIAIGVFFSSDNFNVDILPRPRLHLKCLFPNSIVQCKSYIKLNCNMDFAVCE